MAAFNLGKRFTQETCRRWRDAVAAECGDAGSAPHGFKFQLKPEDAGKPVYVYGIDTDVPGAPFALLRGGRRRSRRLRRRRRGDLDRLDQPAVSGTYGFASGFPGSSPAACTPNGAINPTGADLYRIWVNGSYVAGNWKDGGAARQPFAVHARPGAVAELVPAGRCPVRRARRVQARRGLDGQRPELFVVVDTRRRDR